MLAPEAIATSAQDELVKLDGGTWMDPARGFRAIEGSRVNAWEKDLSPAEIERVNAACRDHAGLRRLGYEFG